MPLGLINSNKTIPIECTMPPTLEPLFLEHDNDYREPKKNGGELQKFLIWLFRIIREKRVIYFGNME